MSAASLLTNDGASKPLVSIVTVYAMVSYTSTYTCISATPVLAPAAVLTPAVHTLVRGSSYRHLPVLHHVY